MTRWNVWWLTNILGNESLLSVRKVRVTVSVGCSEAWVPPPGTPGFTMGLPLSLAHHVTMLSMSLDPYAEMKNCWNSRINLESRSLSPPTLTGSQVFFSFSPGHHVVNVMGPLWRHSKIANQFQTNFRITLEWGSWMDKDLVNLDWFYSFISLFFGLHHTMSTLHFYFLHVCLSLCPHPPSVPSWDFNFDLQPISFLCNASQSMHGPLHLKHFQFKFPKYAATCKGPHFDMEDTFRWIFTIWDQT